MADFDGLRKAAFDGIEFPVASCSVTSDLRVHQHQYRHIPGSNPEKFGRNAYTVEMDGRFFNGRVDYPGLWPGRLQQIRRLFETQETKTLTIPTIGDIPAFITGFGQSADFSIRNGEACKLTFLEDQQLTNLVSREIRVNANSMNSSLKRYDQAVLNSEIDPKPSIFESITDSVNAVLAVKDQFDIFGGLLASKLTKVLEFIEEANRDVVELQDPVNYQVLEAMKDIADATIQLSRDLSDTGRQPLIFICPTVMSVAQISSQLYQSTERSAEIMLNNELSDPYLVKAGTEVVYFSDVVA